MSFADFGKTTNAPVSSNLGGFASFGKPVAPPDTSGAFGNFIGIPDLASYVPNAIDQAKQAIAHPLDTIKSAFGAAKSAIVEPIKSFISNTEKTISPLHESVPERVANTLYALGSAGQVLFSPISAAFAAASKVPVLKEAADVFQIPFAVTGHIGEFASEKFVDVLPIDQASKDILRPAFGEVGALAGQILLGGKVMDLVAKGGAVSKDTITKLVTDTKTEADAAKAETTAPASTSFAEFGKTPVTPSATEPLNPLTQEAQKYKTAEEFVKAMGVKETPSANSRLLYHVSENPNITELKPQPNGSRGVFVTPGEPSRSNGYVYAIDRTKLPEGILKQDPSQARDLYINAPVPKEAVIPMGKIENGKINRVSQLTDIWNKANKTQQPPAAPERPIINGERVAKAASDINQTLIAKGIAELPPEELAKYTPKQVSDQINRIHDLMTTNLEGVKRMFTHNEPIPNDVSPQFLFEALKKYAYDKNDFGLQKELAKNFQASMRSIHGQELGLSGHAQKAYGTGIDVVQELHQIGKIREAKAEKSTGQSVVKHKKEVVNMGKEAIKKSTSKRQTWQEFITQLTCGIE